MDLELVGKTAIVSGGASGIGAAVARLLVAEGARVLVADLNAEPGRELAAELGRRARFEELDVRSERNWEAVVARASAWGGSLDVLVNSAGISKHVAVDRETLDGYRQIVEVNQQGTFLGIREAARRMTGRGQIVNIASINTVRGIRDSIAYAASKAAVVAMTAVAAHELAPRGIRVNAVSPGIVDTPMTSAESSPEVDRMVAPMIQLPGRKATAEEVAKAVVFLASGASDYTTGVELVVDGGVTLTGAMISACSSEAKFD